MVKRFHLIFGLVLFVAFLVTGQFMRHDFPDKSLIDQDFRILMRSRHIYILLIAISNVLLGLYFLPAISRLRYALQMVGSAALTLAGVLMLYAFAVETYTIRGVSEISRFALYAALASMAFHLFGGFRLKSNDNE